MDDNTKVKPVVGMPATICHWTDCDPATVSWVSPSGKTLKVTLDTWKVISGNEGDGSAKYEYETVSDSGAEQTFTLRKNGCWVKKSETLKGGTHLTLNSRRRYYDPSF